MPIDVNAYLDHYLAVVEGALTPVPGKLFVQPGSEVAWDQCDGCDGQGWARLVGMTPVLGNTKANGMPCGILRWNIQIGVGVLRCVHVVDDRGNFPEGAEITDDGHRFGEDLTDLLQAVTCDDWTFSVDTVNPLGPQGGCAGSEVVLTVRVAACGCESDG